jgi:hypothetical protein
MITMKDSITGNQTAIRFILPSNIDWTKDALDLADLLHDGTLTYDADDDTYVADTSTIDYYARYAVAQNAVDQRTADYTLAELEAFERRLDAEGRPDDYIDQIHALNQIIDDHEIEMNQLEYDINEEDEDHAQ